MENKQVLNQEELNQIKEIQDLYSQVVVELGQIDLQINDLNKMIEQLENQKLDTLANYSNNQQKEKKLGEELSKKYGDGTINPNTGEFIPIQK